MVRPLASEVRSFRPCNFQLPRDFQRLITPVLTAPRPILSMAPPCPGVSSKKVRTFG